MGSLETIVHRQRVRWVAVGIPLAVVSGLVILLCPAAFADASAITVTNCEDSGSGSLRQAVLDAASGDTIDFSSSLGCNLITLTSGEIDITQDVSIDGPGSSTLAVSGAGISVSSTASISSLTIENGGGIFNDGNLTIADCVVKGNIGTGILSSGTLTLSRSTVEDNGTGIFNDGGTLSLDNSQVVDNSGSSEYASGIYTDGVAVITASYVSGNVNEEGGFRQHSTAGIEGSGQLTVANSVISDNHTAALGGRPSGPGGISISSGTATVTDSILDSNFGPALSMDQGELTVAGSSLTDNTGTCGGAIDIGSMGGSPQLSVTGTTIARNIAGRGGGLCIESGTATVSTSTIANNKTNGFGGTGVYSEGALDLTHVTIAANANGTRGQLFVGQVSTTIAASIIAGPGTGIDCQGTVLDGGYNLADDSTCAFSSAHNSVSDAPAFLDVRGLQDNGGPTQTIAPWAASPAIDAVAAADLCTGLDQTGGSWLMPCNMGAVQTGPFTATSTAVSANPDPSMYGKPVTLTATVTGSDGTGIVAFSSDGALIPGCASQPLSPVLGGRQASCITSGLNVGARHVTAVYSGNTQDDTSNAALTQTITRAPSATSISSSSNPSDYGQVVKFVAVVSPIDGNGTITFTSDGQTISGCDAVPLIRSGGHYQAICPTTKLQPGPHTIAATYSGDQNYRSSHGQLSQLVARPTVTKLASSTNPSEYHRRVTVTATVHNSDGRGTVGFTADGTAIAGCGNLAVTPSGSAYRATCTLPTLPVAQHTIAGSYHGDAASEPSSAQLIQTVNKGPTTTRLSSSANPSRHGHAITFTARVRPTDGAGTVTFWHAGNTITGCTSRSLVRVNGHYRATCRTARLPVGKNRIKAVYSGDHNCFGSAGRLTQTIRRRR